LPNRIKKVRRFREFNSSSVKIEFFWAPECQSTDLDKENQDLENLQHRLEELKKTERLYPDKVEMSKREVKRVEQQLETKKIGKTIFFNDHKCLNSLM
jgi:hypothetical protein